MILKWARALALAATAALVTLHYGCTGQNKHEETQAYKDSVATAQREAAFAKYDRYWNDYARFLGGMEPLASSKLDSLEKLPEAAAHRKVFDELWKRKENNLLKDLRAWCQKELPTEYADTRTAFYPFAGGDYITIDAIYPNANRYVLFGLEWEGKAPEIKKFSTEKLRSNLANMQYSMRHLFSISFYKTLEMGKELHTQELSGHTPFLMAYLARTGHRVLDVNHFKVTPQGKLEKLPKSLHQTPRGDTTVTGIMIDFRNEGGTTGEGELRQLIYLSVDVNNVYMKQNHMKGFKAYIASLKPANTYLKAASYLMYGYDFSEIRDLILGSSETILQDDSGMPLKSFDKNQWNLKFYGRYIKPIDLFGSKYQPDLFKVYQDTTIKPISFGIGYQFGKGSSNLMLARRKPAEVKQAGGPASADAKPEGAAKSNPAADIKRDAIMPPK